MLGERVTCPCWERWPDMSMEYILEVRNHWERWPDTSMEYVLEVRKYKTLLDPIVLGL
jgi:hypothetical protein